MQANIRCRASFNDITDQTASFSELSPAMEAAWSAECRQAPVGKQASSSPPLPCSNPLGSKKPLSMLQGERTLLGTQPQRCIVRLHIILMLDDNEAREDGSVQQTWNALRQSQRGGKMEGKKGSLRGGPDTRSGFGKPVHPNSPIRCSVLEWRV